MNDSDVYEQWKQQRSSIQPPQDHESKVMEGIAGADADAQQSLTRSSDALLDRPAWAALVVVAASILGMVRMTFSLLIGIQ